MYLLTNVYVWCFYCIVGVVFFGQARHLAYLPYIVLGAGLNKGWRDLFFMAILFMRLFFAFIVCSRWDGRKLDGGF